MRLRTLIYGRIVRISAVAGLVAVALVVPAVGAPKAKSSKSDPVAQSYAALPEPERIEIQRDLIWAGLYLGVADGRFGERAVAAVKAFQKKLGTKETGVFNPKERAALAEAGRKKREAVGWRVLGDSATGVRLGIPAKLVPQAAQVAGGSRWSSAQGEVSVETFRVAGPGTTLEAVAERHRTLPGRKVSYAVMRPDFFVLSGLQSGVKTFYVRATFRQGEVRGFAIQYDQALQVTLDPVVIAMSSAFAAFPEPPLAIVPPARRKVDYGTAVFVSASGHALTTRTLVDGCTVVTLAGFGPADVVATEAAANLALLRIYGHPEIAAIGLAGTSPPESVSLAGVADPARQEGGSAAAILRARLQPTTESGVLAIDPGPEPGFEGAAVIDAGGRLAGVVDLPAPVVAGLAVAPPHAVLIPARALHAFLAKQRVVPAENSRTASEAQKAAVARLICVRK